MLIQYLLCVNIGEVVYWHLFREPTVVLGRRACKADPAPGRRYMLSAKRGYKEGTAALCTCLEPSQVQRKGLRRWVGTVLTL